VNVSLNEAIEIHAQALARRYGCVASASAREHALRLKSSGDDEGHDIWVEVALTVDAILQGCETAALAGSN
jgi:hypothetical protein